MIALASAEASDPAFPAAKHVAAPRTAEEIPMTAEETPRTAPIGADFCGFQRTGLNISVDRRHAQVQHF